MLASEYSSVYISCTVHAPHAAYGIHVCDVCVRYVIHVRVCKRRVSTVYVEKCGQFFARNVRGKMYAGFY